MLRIPHMHDATLVGPCLKVTPGDHVGALDRH